MSDAMSFTIGAKVFCVDGDCGELDRVVMDPIICKVTDLVVKPAYGKVRARLVPIGSVKESSTEVSLTCTNQAFVNFDEAQETRFLSGPGWGYATDWGYNYDYNRVWGWPYYGLGRGFGYGRAAYEPVVYDHVPLGDVQVQRGERVHATDGDIGKVKGLVIDPADHSVTHVLLQEGHLWGKREVAIPIKTVTTITDDVIRVSLSKAEVKDCPLVDINHPGGSAQKL